MNTIVNEPVVASNRRSPSRARTLVLVLIAYLLQILAFTWPLAAHFATRTWGARFDLWTNLWLFWLMKKAIKGLQFSAHTDLAFFPVGENLLSTYGHYWLPALTLPLQDFMSLTVIYNIFLVAALLASAYGGYLLVEYLTGSRGAAFIGGSLLIWSPFVLAEMSVGAVEMVSLQWMPLFFYFLIRAHREGRLAHLLAAAVVLTVSGPFNWLFGLELCLLFALYWLWHILDLEKRHLDRGLLWRGPLLGLMFLVMVAPFLLPFARELSTYRRGPIRASELTDAVRATYASFNEGNTSLDRIEADLFPAFDSCYVLNNSYSLRSLFLAGYNFRPISTGVSIIGLALSIAGMILAGRRGRYWTFIWIIGLILSLGPFLQFSRVPLTDVDLSLPMPFLWLYNNIPIFNNFTRPYRLVLLTILAGVVLSGYAVAAILAWLGSPRRRVSAVLILAGLIMGEYFISLPPTQPRPIADTTIPPIYATLADSLPEGALVEFPCNPLPLSIHGARYLYYQTVHERPLFNTAFERNFLLLDLKRLAAQNSVVQALLELSSPGTPQRIQIKAADRAKFHAWGFRRLLVHTAFEPDIFLFSGPTDDMQMVKEPVLDALEDLFGPARCLESGLLSFDISATFPESEYESGNITVLELSADSSYVPTYPGLSAENSGQVEPEAITMNLPPPGPQGARGAHLGLNPPPGHYRRFSCWVIADRPAVLRLVMLQQETGSHQKYQARVELEGMKWTRVALAPSDFTLLEGKPEGQIRPLEWSKCRWISWFLVRGNEQVNLIMRYPQLVGKREAGMVSGEVDHE